MSQGQELVSTFIADQCVTGSGHEVGITLLRQAFIDWLDEEDVFFPEPEPTVFGRWVSGATEVVRKRHGGEVHYYGIALMADEDNYEF